MTLFYGKIFNVYCVVNEWTSETIQKSQSYVFPIHQVFRQNVPINKRSGIICIASKFKVIIDNKQTANYKL